MMFKMELMEKEAQPVLSIRVRTSLQELPDLIGANYMKILDYLSELGEKPADAPFTAYYNLDMEDLDVEMGFPVEKVLPEKGEIKAGEIPAAKMLATMYKGPYAGMEEPYDKMAKWIDENGYEATGVAYEYYYNSPMDVPEKELLTRIVFPLK